MSYRALLRGARYIKCYLIETFWIIQLIWILYCVLFDRQFVGKPLRLSDCHGGMRYGLVGNAARLCELRMRGPWQPLVTGFDLRKPDAIENDT